jgi:hypothetical protein
MLGHSIVSQHFMEPEGSIPNSQELSTCSNVWSSGQSSWLQIQRHGFDSRHYHIFRKIVGLERGPLSLVSTIEELLKEKMVAPI